MSRLAVSRKFGKDITNENKEKPGQRVTKQKQSKIEGEYQMKEPIKDYEESIQNFIKKLDIDYRFEQSYKLSDQMISDKMRQVLIDWLVDVHQTFQLKQETLHLALMYLSQFQMKRQITKQEYQLIGITCLWIASKYQQIYPPKLKNFAEVTARTYTCSQIKDTESDIIKAFDFQLNKVTPYSLIEYVKGDQKSKYLMKYLIELAWMHGYFESHESFTVWIESAARLSKKILNLPQLQSTSIQVQNCIKKLIILLQKSNKYNLTAIKRKYISEKRMGVGKIKILT